MQIGTEIIASLGSFFHSSSYNIGKLKIFRVTALLSFTFKGIFDLVQPQEGLETILRACKQSRLDRDKLKLMSVLLVMGIFRLYLTEG